MKSITAAFALLLLCGLSLKAQYADTIRKKITPGIYTGGSLSFTGFSLAAGATLTLKSFLFYLGPKLAVTETANGNGPYGLAGGIYFFPGAPGKRIRGFFNADYQALFLKRNVIHEYTAGYGFSWKLSEKVSIVNSINAGRYSERFKNTEAGVFNLSGYNSMLKLGVQIEL